MPEKSGVQRWRERADEVRVQAKRMQDAENQRVLLEVARCYENLAESVERDADRVAAARLG